MDSTRTEPRDARFDGLHAEAKDALGYAANTLRSVRERYRQAYHEELVRWQALRDELDLLERGATDPADGQLRDGPGAEARSAESHARALSVLALRADTETLAAELGRHQSDLGKLELAERSLERAWLFLGRGDVSLVAEDGGLPVDLQMRIVEAQEAERSRLAQEVHDGPAQALSNAIFQVEYIERVLEQDERLARTELRFLRELLRRELGDVRTFITQLRPPRLVQLGLDGAIAETIDNTSALTGVAIESSLEAPPDLLEEAAQTVVLRVVQEALQNIRKHAEASRVQVRTRLEDRRWLLEVRDDGRGFDIDGVAARGRRNFGLQFMRERARLIGAAFEVRSRPDGGTIVALAIPVREEAG